MYEMHGLARVRRATEGVSSAEQAVEVTDGLRGVRLELAYGAYPAELTPDEARFVAGLLVNSAERVEAALAAGKAGDG